MNKLKLRLRNNVIAYNFLNTARIYLKYFFFIFLLPIYFLYYQFTGRNLPKSTLVLINSFCFSSGRSNDVLSILNTYLNPGTTIKYNKIKDDFNINDNQNDIINSLNLNGYYIFKDLIPTEIVKELVHFSLTTTSVLRPMDGNDQFELIEDIYSPINKKSSVYDFKKTDLLNSVNVQRLISNKTFLNVAEKYLNVEPYLDGLSMWWSTNYKAVADKSSAQYFHFDMDNIKWLKFFIYLTDVDVGDGPHVFIAGSHKSGSLPRSILNKGYQRLDDSLINSHFDSNKITTIYGRRGTVIAVDTRGLHKGQNIINNDRLVLQLQFSNSLFGLNSFQRDKVKVDNVLSDNLKNLLVSNPRIYKYFF
jgi:hypothetical protein